MLVIPLTTAFLLSTSVHGAEGNNAFRIMVIGDSISAAYGIPQRAGWVALLQQKLDKEGHAAQVINAAISGDTTAGGLSRLPTALATHKPQLVMLELGGNDGLQGLPLIAMQKNLDRMITLSQQAGADVLLLGMKIPPNYGRRYTEAFGQVYSDLAERHEVPLVSFILEGVAGDPQKMQQDGIHPVADAQPQILDNIWPALQKMLPASTSQ